MSINQNAIKIDNNQFSDVEKGVLHNVWKMSQLREGIVEVEKLKSLIEQEPAISETGKMNPLTIVELDEVWERLDDLKLYLTLKLGCLLADSKLPSLPKEFQVIYDQLHSKAKAMAPSK